MFMESLFLNGDAFFQFIKRLGLVLLFIVIVFFYGYSKGNFLAHGAEMWKSMIKFLAYTFFCCLAVFLRVDPVTGQPFFEPAFPREITLDRAFVVVLALLEAVSSLIDSIKAFNIR